MNLFLDYESEYDTKTGLSVGDLGVRNYALAAKEYLVALVRGPRAWCGEPRDIAEGLREVNADLNSDVPTAANANFDQELWDKTQKPFRQPWECVLDRGRVAQLPGSVAGLSREVLGEKVDKTTREEMNGVTWDSLSEERKAQVAEYCLNDALVEQRLWDALPPMSEMERRLALQTRTINRRGVAINVEAVDRAMTGLQAVLHESFKAIPWSRHAKPLSYPEFVSYCASAGVTAPDSLAKGDMECAEWVKANPGLAPVLAAMRTFRRANTVIEKLKTVKARLGPSDILLLELIFCGAHHTRRWASRGFNIQNLDKEPVKFEFVPAGFVLPGETTPWDGVVWTRPFVVPRAGKMFVIRDLSQIEPRCLWWLVQDHAMLELVRGGFGIYEAHARATMGWAGKDLKKTDPKKYALAKARVLGLGYGCGADKFKVVAKTMAGLDLTSAECTAAVAAFRKSNPKITEFWKFFDVQLGAASKKRETLDIEMPTGELLRHWAVTQYHKPLSKFMGFKSFTVKGELKEQAFNLWGGMITENVTQRMARDVMGDMLLRLEEAGLTIAFHAHDEIILEADESDADEVNRVAEKIMSTPPDWCPDLPLASEGGIYKHYVK